MPTPDIDGRGRRGLWVGLVIAATLTVVICGGAPGALGAQAPDAGAKRAVVTIRMVEVGAPGNAPVGVVPFQGPPDRGILQNCGDAPPGCQLVGGVGYRYKIGELEITVGQYVAFLNTVDPAGRNRRKLYIRDMSPSRWPKYGSIVRSSSRRVAPGKHYSVAYPQWARKPLGFANFLRAARFANALYNGDILSRRVSSTSAKRLVTYKVRLARTTERGMYDLRSGRRTGATRASSNGFVIPSQDEWIKAAYYDPTGGGTFSYWQYPTGPFDPPGASSLNPRNGDVVNAASQPLSTYNPQGPQAPAGTFPTWCPPQAGQTACDTVNPLRLPTAAYQSLFKGNLSTVGQTRTASPWGTLDQGGNAVEWTDTIAPAPAGPQDARVWRRLHGGVSNAPAFQLWISALGLQPQDNVAFDETYPWMGFRVGLVGVPGRKRR